MTLADRYTATAWMRREQDRLWPRVWLLAGPATDDRLVLRVGPLTLAVERTADGWSAPGARCAEHAGLVWVCADPDAPPLTAWLGPIVDHLAPYDLGAMAVTSDLTVELACNWKASVDVHNEGYHVHTLHPEVLGFLDDVGTEITVLPPHARIVVPFGRPSPRRSGGTDPILAAMLQAEGLDPAALADPDQPRDALIAARRQRLGDLPLDDAQLVDNHMAYVFPNLQLNCYADQCLIFRHRPHPHDPGRCFFDQLVLSRRGAPGTRAAAHRTVPRSTDAFGPVTGADLDAVEALQRGMASAGFASPVLCATEAPIAAMHRTLDRWLLDPPTL